ncbi:ribonuclease III [Polymorphobacter fuscus]|uniref:Ribonuclease 3 n=1 Tax=Sandarakinorhabdus fusca TaxID=1439888 RepID=A0A7C9GSN8_9SPHN|nr:ribonuclease III [Polymorphobacter fuscus]KAB7648153.1 ribonuclease III [Polymorphobacter fuscus]MQT15649.1 ribonuclease III [Polymorphobacter fuscus]NJC08082.1 ribonuclease-3 [Polymorphobacter fuscus]
MSHSDADLADWARTRLGHDFTSIALLRRALTHSSASSGPGSYQRLEFLGDRVLGCAVAAWLYADHDEAEGRLTARLHALVEGPANAAVARSLGVTERIVIEHNARAKGLHQSDNVLGDVAEALVAALYLDGGWAVADAFVRREWAQLLVDRPRLLADPKSRLQEWALKRRRGMPVYAVVDRQGPDHAPRFTIEVSVRGEAPARGEGSNKQEAEKAAAVALLGTIGE